jgi:hypothetical protein
MAVKVLRCQFSPEYVLDSGIPGNLPIVVFHLAVSTAAATLLWIRKTDAQRKKCF